MGFIPPFGSTGPFFQFPQNVITEGPRLTRILGPEKNRVRRNRTIGGLWDYTIQKLKKNRTGASNRTIYSVDVNFIIPKPRWSEIRVR